MSEVSERLDEFLKKAENIEPEKKKFVIDSHEKADWAIRHIVSFQKQNEEIDQAADEFIRKTEEWRNQEKQTNQASIDYFIKALQPFALSLIADKNTKTAKFPSGSISFHSVNPKFFIGEDEVKAENEKLTDYIKENAKEYLQVKESVDWGEFKKTLTVTKAGQVISAEGEVLGFISAIEYPDKLTVKERKA